MYSVKRSPYNPILTPNNKHQWETQAAFNWSVVRDKKDKKITHCVYRAISEPYLVPQNSPYISTIGYARSADGILYENKTQLIKPEFAWERYGCEDPRVTELDGKYYVFYTALSSFPFRYYGIKVACAVTRDFKKIESKHLVTPFNSKAMALFPSRIDGKITAILTVNTDNLKRKARIAIAQFNHEDEMWDISYWRQWYKNLNKYALHVRRAVTDHVEVGAAPVKTKDGWLLVYVHIQNYPTDRKIFGVEALLLDNKNPLKMTGRTKHPIMVPEESYEKYGQVPNVIFPSGAAIEDKNLNIYYGASDTTSCVAHVALGSLLDSMRPSRREDFSIRFKKNPVMSPIRSNFGKIRRYLIPPPLISAVKYILYTGPCPKIIHLLWDMPQAVTALI